MNEMIREAMVGALHEVAASSSLKIFGDLIEVINMIREELVLTYMADEYVRLHVWSKIRKEVELTTALLNASVNFTLAIDDIDSAVKNFAHKAICFTSKSKIIDDDLMGKTVSQKELEETLANNHWLFLLLYASTQIYLVNAVGNEYIQGEPNAKTNPR